MRLNEDFEVNWKFKAKLWHILLFLIILLGLLVVKVRADPYQVYVSKCESDCLGTYIAPEEKYGQTFGCMGDCEDIPLTSPYDTVLISDDILIFDSTNFYPEPYLELYQPEKDENGDIVIKIVIKPENICEWFKDEM